MVNRKRVLAALSATCTLGMGACSSIAVKTDTAHDTSLGICHTYAFAQEHVANGEQPAAYANPLNAERLKIAIQANLAARGVQPADSATADCMIGYAMGTRQVFDDYYGGWGLGYGYGWRGAGYGWGGYDSGWVQNETRIAVDVFDNKSHKPIWHASASQNVYELSGPKAVEKINAATAAIFEHFPTSAPTATGTFIPT
jgi:Domain of unknown function (DUF4136)